MSTAAPNLELADLPTHLDAALAKLPASDRELLIRRYFNNLPIAEIATALHLSDNTISKRLARALEKLRHHLARHGFTAPAATLTATLLSTAIRPAPKSLAAHILSNAALTPATPFGVLLMSTPLKLLIALTAFLLLASTATAIVLSRLHNAPPPAPTISIAAPAPSSASASPEQKAEALRALDQCRQSISVLNRSEFSYTIDANEDSPIRGKLHSTQSAKIRRDDRTRWFANSSTLLEVDAIEHARQIHQNQNQTFLLSFLHGQLLTRQSPPMLDPITIWPKAQADLRARSSLEDGLILEGDLLDDSFQRRPDDNSLPPTFFDTVQNELYSLQPQTDPAGHKTVILTSHGPHGLYQLTLDPMHHFLPLRLDVTKTNNDLFHGEPLNTLTGRSQFGVFSPNAPFTSAHLLLDHIHFQSFPEAGGTDVIDSAELAEDRTFDNKQTVTRHITIHRTNIHLNPTFTEADFHLPVPDGTPVTVINRNRSLAPYPALEWRNGQILRTSDHQPPTEEQSTAPEK